MRLTVARHRYVGHHLRLMGRLHYPKTVSTRRQLSGFIDHYLQPDGVFVLRMIGHNSNGLTVTELACSLWDNYRRKAISADLEIEMPAASPAPGSSDDTAERSNDI